MNIINELIKFLNSSSTQFNAVENISNILDKNNFIKLQENEKWNLTDGKYYVTRNGSSIIAFSIPKTIKDHHFQICSSHTDSPTFKIKSVSELSGPNNYLRLNVEAYGGSILYSWFDRPLTVAGRILYKQDNKVISKNIYIDSDLFIIPSMPPHISKEINTKPDLNIQIDLCPLFSSGKLSKGSFNQMIADYIHVKNEDIISYDLYLVNRQEAKLVGLNNEFICSAKLDDLEASFTSLMGFIDSKDNDCIKVYASFDNEEVGSLTKQGASSTFMYDVLTRINTCLNKNSEDYFVSIAKSINVSFDNAHALHPNHPEKFDQENICFMNKGIVIKENASQSYTTDAFSRAIFKNICEHINVPTQAFANRSDSRGGSTLGNLSNNQVSLTTIDIGLAQLSMHSSYETAGSDDVEYAYKAIKEYYSSNIQIVSSESFIIK